MAHPGGRPEIYKKTYPKLLLEYFNVPATTIKKRTIITALGATQVEEEVATRLPTKEGFARKIGVSTRVLSVWMEKHPEFLHAWELAKDCTKDILNENALNKRYSEGYAKFVAINCTDMRDKQEIEHSGGVTVVFEDPFATHR